MKLQNILSEYYNQLLIILLIYFNRRNCNVDELISKTDFAKDDYSLFFSLKPLPLYKKQYNLTSYTLPQDVEKVFKQLDLQKISSFTYAQEGTISKKGGLRDKQLMDVSVQLKNLNLTSLELEMCNNFITEEGIGSFCDNVSYSTNLKKFKIAGGRNQLKDKGAIKLAQALAKFSKLEWLDFCADMNDIGDNGMAQIMKSISQCSQMNYLRLCLRVNGITDQGAISIGNGIKQLKNLETCLVLVQNLDIGESGTEGIMNGLIECPNLKSLIINMSSNQIGNNGVASIGNNLPKIQNLTSLTLILDSCEFDGEGLKHLSNGLSSLVNLNFLSMNVIGTSFERPSLEHLTAEVSKLSKLQEFHIQIEFNPDLTKVFKKISEGCHSLLKLEIKNTEQIDDNSEFLDKLYEYFNYKQFELFRLPFLKNYLYQHMIYNPIHIALDLYLE